MNRNLNTKLVQIFIIFIISVMVTVGITLFYGVFDYFRGDFVRQMENGFSESIVGELRANLYSSDFAEKDKNLLSAYSGVFGFDSNRSFYILDMNGKTLSTNSGNRENPGKTENMLSAMNGNIGKEQALGASIMDYAMYVSNGERECIVYVTDNLSRMQSLTWMLFSIIIQSLLIGLIIAVILSFFLAQAITSPLETITAGTLKISSGDYSHRLPVKTDDEVGVLTRNFNAMAQVIENNLDAVSGEKEKLSMIIECLGDGVAAFDKDGNIMFINSSAKRLLDLDSDTHIDFEGFAERLGVPASMQFLKMSKNIHIAEHQIKSSHSNEMIVDVGFLLFTYDKNETGFLAVIQDVTESALLEKSRREFIANVSHELRTPLTSIKGATETVMLDNEMPESMRNRFLGIVISESDRMTRIVKDLLVLSRFDNRRMTWQCSEFEAGELVNRICTALKTGAEKKSHELICSVEDGSLGVMSADKERIEQVLTNIIGNAIKYTRDGGRIEVSAEKYEDTRPGRKKTEPFVRIKVQDNGIGIPKEDLPRLFERFYRVDKARTSDMGGTGLGLSIAKEIVEAHGGRINVQSKENQGTLVIIELPLDTGIKK